MAGAVKIVVAQFAIDTSKTAGQTQDFTTTDLGGLTPKAAFFIYSNATSAGSAVDDLIAGLGACDASAQWAMGVTSEHGVASVDSSRRGMTDECIVSLLPGLTNIDYEAAFSSFITNGVRVTVGNQAGTAALLTIVFYAGADLLVDVGVMTLGTEDTVINNTGVGFEPDLVLFASTGGNFSDSGLGDAHFTLGAALNDVGVTQKCTIFASDNGTTFGDVECSMLTSFVGGQNNLSGSIQYKVECLDFDTSGFSCAAREGNSLGDTYGYLAIKTDTLACWVGELNTPTSTGNSAKTGVGFKPQMVGLGMTTLASVDTLIATGDAGALGIGVFTANAEFSAAWADEDGSATTDTQSLADIKAVNLPPDDGSATNDFIATGPGGSGSLDTDGWTLNFSAVDTGTVRKWWAFAIEEQIVDTTISVPQDALSETDNVPVVLTGINVPVPQEVISQVDNVPELRTGVAIPIPQDALTQADNVPAVEIGVLIAVPVDTLTQTDNIPVITGSTTIQAPQDALSQVDNVPILRTGVTVDTPQDSLSQVDNAPTIDTPVRIQVPVNTLSQTDNVPGIGTGVLVSSPADILTLIDNAPFISISVLVPVPLDNFTQVDNAPIITVTPSATPVALNLQNWNTEYANLLAELEDQPELSQFAFDLIETVNELRAGIDALEARIATLEL